MAAPTAKLQLEIVTPAETVFRGSVALVTMPASEGEMGVMAHHAPLIASLDEGVVRLYDEDNGTVSLERRISGGFVDIADNKCTILAERLLG